jgi:hypothetical protein
MSKAKVKRVKDSKDTQPTFVYLLKNTAVGRMRPGLWREGRDAVHAMLKEMGGKCEFYMSTDRAPDRRWDAVSVVRNLTAAQARKFKSDIESFGTVKATPLGLIRIFK